MTVQWPVVSLESVLISNRSGFWGDSEPTAKRQIKVNVIRNADLTRTGKRRSSAERYFSEREAADARIEIGDIVMSTSGEVGKIWQATEEGLVASNFVRVMRPDPTKVIAEFLRFAFSTQSMQLALNECTSGMTISNLKKAFYAMACFSLPSLGEQRRIVAILEDVFDNLDIAIANSESTLINSRALFPSLLSELIQEGAEGWASSTLGSTNHFIDYRGKTPAKTQSGIRLITAKNVKMGKLLESPAEYVDPSSYDSWMTRGIPVKGDILFTTEAPLANVAELDTEDLVVFAQRIIIMQPNKELLYPRFVKYLLMSRPVQQRIHQQGTGATVKGIKASLLKQIPIYFPSSLHEQVAIANKLADLEQNCERLVEVIESKLRVIDALKYELLHRAFTGQL